MTAVENIPQRIDQLRTLVDNAVIADNFEAAWRYFLICKALIDSSPDLTKDSEEVRWRNTMNDTLMAFKSERAAQRGFQASKLYRQPVRGCSIW